MSLLNEVQKFIEAHPGCTSGDIADAFAGYSRQRVLQSASKLRQSGRVAHRCEGDTRRHFPRLTERAQEPVQFYPGKHPCEKPADMLRQIINASSRPGDLVADFFMGSGSTIKAAMALGRRALGVELESERFNQTVKEINELVGK